MLAFERQRERVGHRLEQQAFLGVERVVLAEADEQEPERRAARDQRQRGQCDGRLTPQQRLARHGGGERLVEAGAVVAHDPLHRAAVLGEVRRLDARTLIYEQRPAAAIDTQQARACGPEGFAQVLLGQVP